MDYSESFSEKSFWTKVKGYALAAGREVVEKALMMYYAARAPETPTWAKGVLYGALGYFISPIDAIPDLVPVVGYTDDLGVIVAALVTCAVYITPEIKAKAAAKVKELF